MVLAKILIFTILILLGLAILAKTEPIVRFVGKAWWAENRLGSGGTYLMWKIIGIIVIILGVIVITGGFDWAF